LRHAAHTQQMVVAVMHSTAVVVISSVGWLGACEYSVVLHAAARGHYLSK
jgi:hypothetical protein